MRICPAEADIRLSRTNFTCDTTVQFTFEADSANSASLPKISILNAATSAVIDTWNSDGTAELAAGTTAQSTALVCNAQNEGTIEIDEATNFATFKAEVCQGAKCNMLDAFPSTGILNSDTCNFTQF